jgi:hypothetical protein
MAYSQKVVTTTQFSGEPVVYICRKCNTRTDCSDIEMIYLQIICCSCSVACACAEPQAVGLNCYEQEYHPCLVVIHRAYLLPFVLRASLYGIVVLGESRKCSFNTHFYGLECSPLSIHDLLQEDLVWTAHGSLVSCRMRIICMTIFHLRHSLLAAVPLNSGLLVPGIVVM